LLDLFQPFPAAAPPHAGGERGAAALLLRAAVRPACALPNPGRRRSQAAAATARAGALPCLLALAPLFTLLAADWISRLTVALVETTIRLPAAATPRAVAPSPSG